MVAIDKKAEDEFRRLPAEVDKLLHSLASEWEDVADTKQWQVVQLKGAMTNEVFQCLCPSKKEVVLPRKVLVRLYGEGVDVFFNRNDEVRTFECMSKHGQGPRLLGQFHNGRVEEFIHARTLSAPDLRDAEISALIATKLREFHDLDMQGPKEPILWDRLRNWLAAARKVCTETETSEFELDKIDTEISFLEKELFRENQKMGFCHNDLQYGNIMIDEETKVLTIIDYEYAGFNPVAYDIANHFCEMVADYHTETPHILDFNKYPDIEERKRFVQNYLSSSASSLWEMVICASDRGGSQICSSSHIQIDQYGYENYCKRFVQNYLSSSVDDLSELEVELLVDETEKYALASHLGWALWGIISEHVNDIDFDYMEYARQRFKQYWLMKPTVLGC